MAQLEPLMKRNFLEYASYVVTDRAIPDLRDGLKPVQRRILHTLFEMNDGRFHKVANVIGETMKLHPHGDAAISDALVVLANKDYFIERQGNFGSILTGHPAAASRYIECRLTPLALETMFHPDTTRFRASYDGRKNEPTFLPVKLPVLLMLGPEGIAVGMATKVLPHNFVELLQAQVALLRGNEARLVPDFPQGGFLDASEYEDGRGKVKVRANIQAVGDKKIRIDQVPFSTTTESLIHSIETAASRGQLKIASLHDYTTDHVEIEIDLPRGVYANEVIPQLYAYTDCEVAISSNIVAIHEDKPVDLTVTQVLAALTDQLLAQLKVELEFELARLKDKHHWLTLEQLFIENRIYKKIEKAKTLKAVRTAVWQGMHEFALYFVRPMVDEDVDRLLAIRIQRISQYDIDKYKKDVKEVARAIKECEKKLKQLKRTTIKYLQDLLKKYGKRYPRRSRITTFKTVDKKTVARQSLRVSYDPKTGFFGSKVRGSLHQHQISEFDRLLIITNDGSYRIVGAVEKLLLPGKVLYCEIFDQERGKTFTLVYRNEDKIAYGKRFHIEKFVKDKEYLLSKEPGVKVDLLLDGDNAQTIRLDFRPRARQKITHTTSDLSELEVQSVTARGRRLASKPVAKIVRTKSH